MSKHRNQTVIIPSDQVTPDEALVIEIPRALRNKPVVIAKARASLQAKTGDNTDYSIFLNNLQSSKSAPGIMAFGHYMHSSTQHGGQSSFQPQPAAQTSQAVPTHSQTISGQDKQCGNLTANIFIHPSNNAAVTTSTESLSDLNKNIEDEDDDFKNKETKKQQEVQSTSPSTSDSSKFFENLVKAIWMNPAADDCKPHCLNCCGKEQHVSSCPVKSQANFSCATSKTFCERSQMVVMWDDDSASRPSFDDCQTFCLKCCGVTTQTSNSEIRPIAPMFNKSHSNQSHDCKSHCEKCCTNSSHKLSPIPDVSPETEDCLTHCEECCNGQWTAPPPLVAHPSALRVPKTTLMDDCEKYCSSERLEPPPCVPQPSKVSCKPSVPTTLPPGYFRVHCSKCCELASGNKAPSGGHFKCTPSSSIHCAPKDNSAPSGGHFKCTPSSSIYCAPKDNSEATPEDEDQSYCCMNHKDQSNALRWNVPPASRDKDIVELYECDSRWSSYSTKADPCGCSDWEENQRPQGDFEFGEHPSKTCEISCDSEIAELNDRLDKICAKIDFYEKCFSQAEQDLQKMRREYFENQPESTTVIQKCEPEFENRSKSEKTEPKSEKQDESATKAPLKPKPQEQEKSKSSINKEKIKPQQTKEYEEKPKSTRLNMIPVSKEEAKPRETKDGEQKPKPLRASMDWSGKEKADIDLCQYCCSRSSLKSLPSTCAQHCKAKLQKSEEQIRSNSLQGIPQTQKRHFPQPKPAIRQPETEQITDDSLPMTESKYKKSCKFVEENVKREDASSKRASQVSVGCKCGSTSQNNVLKPIIKAESGKCESKCSFQIQNQQPSQQELESQRRASQNSFECSDASQISKMCTRCCEEASQKKTMSQSQASDGISDKCPFEKIRKSTSSPTNKENIYANYGKPQEAKPEITKSSDSHVCGGTKCGCVKTKKEDVIADSQDVCKRCCSDNDGQNQTVETCKDFSKDPEGEPQESPPAQRKKCTKCNKEYTEETARKIRSEFREGLCETCCLEALFSRLTLRAEPDDGTAPDTSEEVSDKTRSSTLEIEEVNADSSSRLEKDTSETDKSDKMMKDEETQDDLGKEEHKKKSSSFFHRKKSDKETKQEDKSSEKEK